MSWRLGICGLVSLAVHLALVAGLLLGRWPAPLVDAPDKPVMVELVMEEQKGAGETVVRPPSPPPEEAAHPKPEPPTPPADDVPSSSPVAAAPSSPVPPADPVEAAAPAAPANPPAFNFGGTDSESNTLVTGDNVIPASPDKKARNRPPPYPEDAARRGQQGAVLLVIHVSPGGLTEGVDVLRSSGYASLDRAARDAVMTWRFLPAVKDGAPIPFDFRMNFVFSVN